MTRKMLIGIFKVRVKDWEAMGKRKLQRAFIHDLNRMSLEEMEAVANRNLPMPCYDRAWNKWVAARIRNGAFILQGREWLKHRDRYHVLHKDLSRLEALVIRRKP